MKLALTILGTAAIALAAPATAADTVTDALTNIEHKWVEAVIKRDAASLSSILASDWHGQSLSGKRNDKAKSLASLKDMDDVLTKSTLHDIHVIVLSPTIAVVQGSEDDVGSYHGKDTSGAYNWTDVFQKRGGKWVAVASQFTKVEPS